MRTVDGVVPGHEGSVCQQPNFASGLALEEICAHKWMQSCKGSSRRTVVKTKTLNSDEAGKFGNVNQKIIGVMETLQCNGKMHCDKQGNDITNVKNCNTATVRKLPNLRETV